MATSQRKLRHPAGAEWELVPCWVLPKQLQSQHCLREMVALRARRSQLNLCKVPDTVASWGHTRVRKSNMGTSACVAFEAGKYLLVSWGKSGQSCCRCPGREKTCAVSWVTCITVYWQQDSGSSLSLVVGRDAIARSLPVICVAQCLSPTNTTGALLCRNDISLNQGFPHFQLMRFHAFQPLADSSPHLGAAATPRGRRMRSGVALCFLNRDSVLSKAAE